MLEQLDARIGKNVSEYDPCDGAEGISVKRSITVKDFRPYQHFWAVQIIQPTKHVLQINPKTWLVK